MNLLDRELLIIGGKGGTGKSSVASAVADLSALRGARTLLVSADGSPGAAGLFGVEPRFEPTEVAENLSVMRVDTRSSLSEFVRIQLGPLGAVSGPVASALSFVAEAAPGVGELLLVGKYAHEVREGSWDLVVVDAAASGHLLGELAAPAGVHALAPIGRLGLETGWMVDLLGDPDVTGVINVTLAEEVPVSETLEFVERLHADTPVHLATVLVNRTRPQLYSRALRARLETLLDDPPKRRTRGTSGLLDGVRVGLDRADVASAIDVQLRTALPAGTPVMHVPEFSDPAQVRMQVRDAIAEELSL